MFNPVFGNSLLSEQCPVEYQLLVFIVQALVDLDYMSTII